MTPIAGRPVEEVLGLRFDRLAPSAWAALACALAALWLLGRRYGGITHDATLYLAQGLRRLDPAVFDRDLFFAYGGQDEFTVFPLLYASLIDAFGGGSAAMLVTVAGQVAFLGAAAALVSRLGAGQARWWSLALLAAVSGFYGGQGVFRFAESFATARTLAEPLVLAALALSLAARHGVALAALAAAALLHPLVAASGLVVLYLWHALERPRLFWLLPALGAAALAAAVLWPAATLRFDDAWRDAVIIRSPHLFIALWPVPDLARFVWGVLVIALAARFLENAVLRIAIAAVIASCVAVIATALTVDMLDSALVAALQPWRVHWLMHFLAIALVPFAVVGLWRAGGASRAAAACLSASCCFGRFEMLVAALFVAFAVLLDYAERRRPGWMGERALRLVLVGALAAASVGLMFEMQTRLPPGYAIRVPAWTDYVPLVGTVGMLPLALVLWLTACSRWPRAGLVLAIATLATAIAAWDARSPWSRYIEQADGRGHPFQGRITPGATVFWPEPGGPTWHLLRAASWFSVDQGAGIVFNRATAIEYNARREASLELRAGMQNCLYFDRKGCTIKREYAQRMCARPGRPDYLVLNGEITGYPSVEWRLPRELGFGRHALHLYACRDFA
jgi:hypothetical protein